MVDLASKILLYDKLRFAITVSGVAFAVMLVLVQVGLFLGLLDNASVTIEHLDADLWVTARNTPNIDFANTFPETLVQRVRSIPGVERADNLIVWFASVALPSGAKEGVQLYALEDFHRWGFPWNVVEGDVRDLRRGDYVFIDDSAKKRFGEFQAGDYREFLGRRLKIIGRTRGAVSFTTSPLVFMDYRLAQELSWQELSTSTTYIIIKLAPGADAAQVTQQIRQRLPYNDVYTRADWAAQSRWYWIESTGLGLNLFLTVFLGCLVGIVVVAQTLYTSTMEHLREFGTVKAIGGGNGDIYRILAEQATIAAIAGFCLGAGMTWFMRYAMAAVDLNLIIPTRFWGIVLAGTLLFCLAASLVSFWKVAKVDPALVFRT